MSSWPCLFRASKGGRLSQLLFCPAGGPALRTPLFPFPRAAVGTHPGPAGGRRGAAVEAPGHSSVLRNHPVTSRASAVSVEALAHIPLAENRKLCCLVAPVSLSRSPVMWSSCLDAHEMFLFLKEFVLTGGCSHQRWGLFSQGCLCTWVLFLSGFSASCVSVLMSYNS